MTKRTQAPSHLDPEDARALIPLLKAGLRGLDNSRWRPGQQAEYLVVPIVLAVIAEAARQLRLDDLSAELAAARARRDPLAGRDLSHITRAAEYYQETGYGY